MVKRSEFIDSLERDDEKHESCSTSIRNLEPGMIARDIHSLFSIAPEMCTAGTRTEKPEKKLAKKRRKNPIIFTPSKSKSERILQLEGRKRTSEETALEKSKRMGEWPVQIGEKDYSIVDGDGQKNSGSFRTLTFAAQIHPDPLDPSAPHSPLFISPPPPKLDILRSPSSPSDTIESIVYKSPLKPLRTKNPCTPRKRAILKNNSLLSRISNTEFNSILALIRDNTNVSDVQSRRSKKITSILKFAEDASKTSDATPDSPLILQNSMTIDKNDNENDEKIQTKSVKDGTFCNLTSGCCLRPRTSKICQESKISRRRSRKKSIFYQVQFLEFVGSMSRLSIFERYQVISKSPCKPLKPILRAAQRHSILARRTLNKQKMQRTVRFGKSSKLPITPLMDKIKDKTRMPPIVMFISYELPNFPMLTHTQFSHLFRIQLGPLTVRDLPNLAIDPNDKVDEILARNDANLIKMDVNSENADEGLLFVDENPAKNKIVDSKVRNRRISRLSGLFSKTDYTNSRNLIITSRSRLSCLPPPKNMEEIEFSDKKEPKADINKDSEIPKIYSIFDKKSKIPPSCRSSRLFEKQIEINLENYAKEYDKQKEIFPIFMKKSVGKEEMEKNAKKESQKDETGKKRGMDKVDNGDKAMKNNGSICVQLQIDDLGKLKSPSVDIAGPVTRSRTRAFEKKPIIGDKLNDNDVQKFTAKKLKNESNEQRVRRSFKMVPKNIKKPIEFIDITDDDKQIDPIHRRLTTEFDHAPYDNLQTRPRPTFDICISPSSSIEIALPFQHFDPVISSSFLIGASSLWSSSGLVDFVEKKVPSEITTTISDIDSILTNRQREIFDQIISGSLQKEIWTELLCFFDEMKGNSTKILTVKKWLIEWRNRLSKETENNVKVRRCRKNFDCDYEEDDPIMANPLIVSGPVGVGKTSLVYKLARQLGMEVIEMASNSHRSGAQLRLNLNGATHTRRVSSMSTASRFFVQSEKSIHSIILIDDADILLPEDDCFWSCLRTLISESNIPIVLTCKDYYQCQNELIGDESELMLESVHLERPNAESLAKFIQTVLLCLANRLVPLDSLGNFCRLFDCDIRRCLLEAQFWADNPCNYSGLYPDSELDPRVNSELGSQSALFEKNSQLDPSYCSLLLPRTSSNTKNEQLLTTVLNSLPSVQFFCTSTALTTDYCPYLGLMSRISDQQKETSRNRRFRHYFDRIGLQDTIIDLNDRLKIALRSTNFV